MSRILLSYRREDSAAYAGRIADRLRQHFGRENVFIDIDAIRPGDDFVRAIETSVRSCDAVVAVIGRNWTSAVDAGGRRRLERNDDFVRLEIATALERDIRVVPVLVAGSVMPEAHELPPDLAGLPRRQALEISDVRFHYDVDQLIKALSDAPADDPHSDRTSQSTAHQNKPPVPRFVGRSMRRWLPAVTAVAAVLSISFWIATVWNPFAGRSPAVVDVAPAEGRSAGSARSVALGGPINKITLAQNEEAYFRLATPAREFRIILDARCSTGHTCSLGTAVSLFDADGTVIQDRTIRVTRYDVAFRSARTFALRAPAQVQFKLVNDSSERVDYWLAVLDAAVSDILPLFGTVRPKPFEVGSDESGVLDAGGATIYTTALTRGDYAVTLDLSVAPRDAEPLSGYAAVAVASGGDESKPVAISHYGVSTRTTGTLPIEKEGVYVFRIQSQHVATMNYMFKLTRR
jgi:hypothetical protein